MEEQHKEKYTQMIKAEAKRLGFLSCGISKADFLEAEAPRLESWLNNNYHGQMAYMANHFDKRLDPRLLVDGAQSVVSLLLNYYPSEIQNPDSYKVSKYAYGQDYHKVIKQKLTEFLQFISQNIGEVNGRAFVDSAPVLDKAWAAKSGLGWVGKNNNLISKKQGSFFFVAELIIDLPLQYDQPTTDHCGSCTKCIDACPTQAITQAYTVDGSKCVSYYTIELKENIPDQMRGKFDNWMFGCDVCQDVCPWNRFSQPNTEKQFVPNAEWLEYSKTDWEEITQDTFHRVFVNSPLKRSKYEGIVRNVKFLKY